MSGFLNQSVVTPSDLARFNCLQTPVWIFDVDYMRMWWANQSAIHLWNADNLQELLDRDWNDYSDATHVRFQDYLSQFNQGHTVTEQWTFYPQEESPISVSCTFSAIWIEAGRLAMLVEGTPQSIDQVDSHILCSLEALRHTTVMISLYDLRGQSILQNPAALECYGNDREYDLTTDTFIRRFTDPRVAYQVMAWVKAGRFFKIEAQVNTLQGIQWHEIDVRYTRDPLTGQTAVLVNEHNITNRKRSEAERKQAEVALEQQLWREQLLSRITQHIRQDLDVQAIFQRTATEVRHAFSASRCNIFIYDELPQPRCILVAEDYLPEFPNYTQIEISVEDTLFFHQLLSQPHPLASVNVFEEPLLESIYPLCYKNHLKSLLIVQTAYKGHVNGVIALDQCDRFREWSIDEVKLLEEVAIQVGIALFQAKLLEQEKYQRQQLADKNIRLEKAKEEIEATLIKLKKTQTQLIQTEKMSGLGQMVAGIAHEINNPVSFIYGNLEHVQGYARNLIQLINLYQANYPEPIPEIQSLLTSIDLDFLIPDLEKVLGSMETGAERITDIVTSLRNFSRLDEAEKKDIDIHTGLDSTLVILQSRIKSVGHFTEIEIFKDYGDIPEVFCYASQLNQVFMNLFVNAIDALDEQRQQDKSAFIRIQTAQVGNEVSIVIEDNGPGMDHSTQHQIFDPFFTTKPIGKGTGLGLSISYQIIVEKHGGSLECQSRLGQGTVFTIKIPVEPSDPLDHSSVHLLSPSSPQGLLSSEVPISSSVSVNWT